MAPYSDDFSLFNTQGEFYRGGVWDPTPRSSKATDGATEISSTDRNPVQTTDVERDSSSANNREQAKKARLRQRKSTPDLRASRDIDADSEFIPDMPSTLLRKNLHKHKSSDALRALPTDDSSNSFDDDIDELQHVDSNANLGMKETPADSKTTLASTVKRWGSWYFKDNTSNTGNTPTKSPDVSVSKNQPASRRQSAPSESVTVRREPSFKKKWPQKQSPEVKPVSAPAPHKFPTELLNSIADDNRPSLRPAAGRTPARSNSMTDTASNRTMQKNMMSSYRKVEHAKSAYNLSDYSESSLRTDLNVSSLIESDKETKELDQNGSQGNSQTSDSVNLRKAKPIASSVTRGSMGRKSSEPYLSWNRSLSFGSSETLAASTLPNFKGELNDQECSIPLNAPSLDQVPIELANSVTPDSETNFSVPLLAPPPPMHDRSLTKRRSKDALRQSTLQSNSLPPSSTQPNLDSVITVPKPSLSAAPYSHEQDLNDFLIETAAKYESTQLFDHLSIDREVESSSSSSLPRANSQKASEKSRNGDVLLESSSSFSHSSITGSSKASSINYDLNESTPVLSYRKVKSKQSQGFKFF